MKLYVIIFATIVLMVSCSTIRNTPKDKNDDSIIYVLPPIVEQKLPHSLYSDSASEYFFELVTLKNGHFCLYMFKKSTNSTYKWVDKTKRKIYLSNHFYPLIFDYDGFFAITESEKEFLKRQSSDEITVLKREIIISHSFFFVEFFLDKEFKVARFGNQ